MTFRAVFAAVFIGAALVAGAFIINAKRPVAHTSQPSPEFVRATGKCAECHMVQTSAVVHQFERSRHAAKGLTCLDCHQKVEGQEELNHMGFLIAKEVTALNCSQCHPAEYEQYLRSRHAAPAWAAVRGGKDFTAEQIAHAEEYHAGAVTRAANTLAIEEGPSAMMTGCQGCHSVGKPNADGSIGSCTACHSRHSSSIELARQPETCGQCHMGPDHSQVEIYHESKHGVIFNAQRATMDLTADPKDLTTADMPVPTCSTCHMSGLEGMNMTHDTTERLSWWLFAAVSEKRPTYRTGQENMQEICLKCHTQPHVEKFYANAEAVLHSTNDYVAKANAIMKGLRDDGLLTPEPFDEPIEFLAFDLWHYFGRTAKHGAFMGGADFVQWHGNYELLNKLREMEEIAANLRKEKKDAS